MENIIIPIFPYANWIIYSFSYIDLMIKIWLHLKEKYSAVEKISTYPSLNRHIRSSQEILWVLLSSKFALKKAHLQKYILNRNLLLPFWYCVATVSQVSNSVPLELSNFHLFKTVWSESKIAIKIAYKSTQTHSHIHRNHLNIRTSIYIEKVPFSHSHVSYFQLERLWFSFSY